MSQGEYRTPVYRMGVYIALLYFLFLVTVFCGFVGHILRVDLGRSLNVTGDNIDATIFKLNEEKRIETAIPIQKAKLKKAKIKLSEIRPQLQLLSIKDKSNTKAMGDNINLASQIIGSHSDILAQNFREQFEAAKSTQSEASMDRAAKVVGVWSTLKFAESSEGERQKAFKEKAEPIIQRVEEARKIAVSLFQEATKLNAERTNANSDAAVASAEIERLTNSKKQLSEAITTEHRAIIDSFRTSFFRFTYFLISTPTIILTLIVTVAAGGLGSVVAFTRSFMRGDEGVSLGKLLVNVGEGVAAAIAIFLLAGTGMLMLTQGTSGAQGQVELGPYMVASIAFISGFMAEDAFKRIQYAGKNLFRLPEEEEGK